MVDAVDCKNEAIFNDFTIRMKGSPTFKFMNKLADHYIRVRHTITSSAQALRYMILQFCILH
jgi:hypothetical protein